MAKSTPPRKLRTYHSRRDNFYSSYNPPTYVYNSAPSFGAWDAMFLWMMLDRPNYHSTYYHHQNDLGFQQWRKEAEKQAAENAELRSKLDKLDAKVNAMDGTKVDPSYVPAGVDGDLMLSEKYVKGLNKELTQLRLATARAGNNYHNLGSLVKKKSQFGVNLVTSAGSMENLDRLNQGKVDAAIVQSDAFKVWDKENSGKEIGNIQAPLYKEYVHVIANRKSGISNVSDMTPEFTVYITEGSGAEVTWKAFGLEDAEYKKIPVKNAPLHESLLKVAAEPKSVLVFVSGLNSRFIKVANRYGNKVKLLNVDDKDFDNAVDQYGNKIYSFTNIPGKTYENLQDGVFLSSIETLSVDAVLVVSKKWKKKQGKTTLESLTGTVVTVLPDFKKKVERNSWFQ